MALPPGVAEAESPPAQPLPAFQQCADVLSGPVVAKPAFDNEGLSNAGDRSDQAEKEKNTPLKDETTAEKGGNSPDEKNGKKKDEKDGENKVEKSETNLPQQWNFQFSSSEKLFRYARLPVRR